MTQQNKLTPQQIHPVSLGIRMLEGAGIALILILIFLLGAGEPDPDWHRLWMIRPLIIVPLAGALGGVHYYFMDHLRYQGGWKKVLSIFLSLLVYLIVLWLGTVLGLDGTWWD
jgi:hypothetical protein